VIKARREKILSLVSSDCFFLIASLLFCFFLYLPGLNGKPIWDDLAYWIHNPDMHLPIWKFWTTFAWPLSISAQKIILDSFGDHYLIYHLINLSLHFINSFLVYRLAKILDWPKPRWIFLLFLVHPANVISVAWMIQLKTLLCFIFAILSFFFFEKGLKENKWFYLTLLFFILSMLSKSSSITLPILFFIYGYHRIPLKKWLWCLPFCAIALGGGYALLRTQPISEVSAQYRNSKPVTVVQTSRYYFLQTLFPLENAPIKGRAPTALQISDAAAFIFLVALMIVFWRKRLARDLGWYLIGGFVLLIPFLGFIFAPFMTITWVSDQHLYLALPVFLAFWMMLFERIAPRFATLIAGGLLIFFVIKTVETVPSFVNEDNFYTASLNADPGNVIIAFNYANTLAYHDHTDKALEIANGIHELAQASPVLQADKHYSEIEALRLQLISFQAYKKQKQEHN
jgi:hypothetical protein